MNDDIQQLRAYANEGSEESFRRVVERHVHLVYSVALRRVGGEHALAEEVTQTVFADLGRKASSLPEHLVLGGWLHRHTCYVASNAVRTEARRRDRERNAAAMNQPDTYITESWQWIAPALDEALNRLSAADRDALVLRFYEGRDLRDVGAVLGLNEDAAQKRVSRALEKLRVLLQRRGVGLSLSGTGLATLLSSQAVAAAPAHVVCAVSASALAGAAAAGSTGTLLQLITMTTITKLKVAAVGALIVGVAVPIAVQRHSLNQLKKENSALVQQAAGLAELDKLRDENRRLSEIKVQAEELDRLRASQTELMRLRGEVGRLRQDMAESKAAVENQKAAAKASEQTGPYQPNGSVTKETMDLMHQIGNAVTASLMNGQSANLDEIRKSLPAKLAGKFDPAMIDPVHHERALTKEDLGKALIVLREPVPRQLDDGRWERMYTWADGTSQLVWLRNPTDYDRWEKPWIASSEFVPFSREQKPQHLDRSADPKGLTPIVEVEP